MLINRHNYQYNYNMYNYTSAMIIINYYKISLKESTLILFPVLTIVTIMLINK